VLPPKDPDFINPFGLRPPFRTKPVVVAAQGATQLGAHELFLACDIRVAATDAVFRQHEVVRGVFPGGGATVRMTREAGWANAMRYLLTGDEWGAEEARRLSLVQEITPPGKQLDRAIELAQKIAAAAPLGVSATLATAHQAISSEEAALQGLLPEFQKITQSEDAQEAQRAFSGRPPARVPRVVSRRGYCDLATPLRLTKAGMAVVVAAASVNGGAMEHGYAQTLVTHRIPAALAMEAVEAAVAACAGQGYGVTATVIDADAERIAVLRGDTAGVHTFEASWGKAYTAVGFAPIFKLDSGGEVAERVAQFSARQLAGTLPFQPPESMIFRAGGLTIKLGDEVLGAIGVGGAPTAQADEACARAGLDKIRDRLR